MTEFKLEAEAAAVQKIRQGLLLLFSIFHQKKKNLYVIILKQWFLKNRIG